MAGIYIHIPFCKQACHYCDFHFSTSLKKRVEMVEAICLELVLRKKELTQPIETIYFGGGTPSLLTSEELQLIINTIHTNFDLNKNLEVTIEVNPDDLVFKNSAENKSKHLFESYKEMGINRLSIGVQSFFEEDLELMNRAHNKEEALLSIELAKQFFSNISIDLIYGIPGMSNERWMANLEKAISFKIPHLSCYALTVEPNTALKKFIDKGIIAPVDEEKAAEQHALLIDFTQDVGLINYEFSNFGKPDCFSKNNLAYWSGKPYLGIGPSAHSYDGKSRKWNVKNNSIYIKSISNNTLPQEIEELTLIDKYNEYVMTRLRTMWGISLQEIESIFGKKFEQYLLDQSEEHIDNGYLKMERGEEGASLIVTKKGKFFSDGIASDLFFVE